MNNVWEIQYILLWVWLAIGFLIHMHKFIFFTFSLYELSENEEEFPKTNVRKFYLMAAVSVIIGTILGPFNYRGTERLKTNTKAILHFLRTGEIT